MTPEQWRQISEVAASAMELTGDEPPRCEISCSEARQPLA